jgi:hypothetical protein
VLEQEPVDTGMRRSFALAVTVLATLAGCSDPSPQGDAGFDATSEDIAITDDLASPLEVSTAMDAGLDAGMDAGLDAGMDAGLDANVDAGLDAPTVDAPEREDITVDAAGPDVPAPTDAPGDAMACPPEPTMPDDLGEPRNAAGDIRYCWPGEAHCLCDSDGDCYASEGYVGCGLSDGGARADVPPFPDAGPPLDAGAPEQGGQWSETADWPVLPVHAALLPNGRVIAFPTRGGGAQARVWDPATNAFTPVPISRTNVGCGGHSFLTDGRLVLTGGELEQGDHYGPPEVNVFSFATNTWAPAPTMNAGRWYPTNTAMPNGDVLVTAGDITPGERNRIPQLWTPGDTAWRSLTEARLSLPTYPFMFVAPDGRVFYAGPEAQTRMLDTAVTAAGAGAWTNVAVTPSVNHNEGTAVMYDDGRVLVVGGANPPIAAAEVIDLNEPTPTWRSTSPMSVVRRQINATLLPDGAVLVTGGTRAPGDNNPDGAVFNAESWDPATGRWTLLAAMHTPRLYHSIALLLPDARVLVGGGRLDRPGANVNLPNVELYSPPYLFRGARPVISSAPERVAYGSTFLVGTADAASVRGATLIRPGAVTHGFDQSQRINRLRVAPAAGGVTVTAPVSRNLCPPGYYMLFLLNDRGVPSVARMVQVS